MENTRKIKKIVIHVSDTEDSLDIGAREIREWHTRDNGWSDIGYHAVVRRDGRIEPGRSEALAGAHVYGHNKDSLGICWVGRKNIDPRQYSALRQWVRKKLDEHGLTVEDVYGHCELDDKKTCPNMDMNLFRAELLFTFTVGV